MENLSHKSWAWSIRVKNVLAKCMAAMLVADGIAQAATYQWTGGGTNNNFDNGDNWDRPKSPIGDHRAPQGGSDYAFNNDAEVANLDADTMVVNDAGWSLNVSRVGGAVLNIGNETVLDSENTRAGFEPGGSGTINLAGGSELQAGNLLVIGSYGGTGAVNVTDSSVMLDSGARIYIGYNADGAMTLNGASSSVAVDGAPLFMSYDEGVDSTLTINGGLVDGGWYVQMGGDTGTDTGTSRIFINGGALKANQLFFNMADAKLVYTGGSLMLHQDNVSQEDMQAWIDAGRIDVSGVSGYALTTTNVNGTSYTALVEAAWPDARIVAGLGIRPTDPQGLAGLHNPERGFFTESQIAEGSNTTSTIFGLSESVKNVVPPNPFFTDDRWVLEAGMMQAHGVSLVQTCCYLTEYRDGPIPQSKLDLLQESFDRLRVSGMKAVLRFAYAKNMDYASGAELGRMLDHIDQLAPIIQTNSDVVFSMEAGFIGAWGEWHSDQYMAPGDYAARAQIVKKLVDILPGNQSVQIRTPQARSNLLAEATVFTNAAMKDAYADRTGFCNGGFFAGKTDGGTWKEAPWFAAAGNPSFDAVTVESANMLVGGELFWSNPGQMEGSAADDGLAAAERMRLHHYSLFGIARSYSVHQGANYAIDHWMVNPITKQQLINAKMPVSDGYFENQFGNEVPRTQFEYIRDHLGYRLELQRATFQARTNQGGDLTVGLELVNRGFSAPHNPRNAYIVLIGMDGKVTPFDTGADPRQWQPFAPGDPNYAPLVHNLGVQVPLPPEVVPGYYHLGLWMPDSSSSIRLDPRYAVRLANRNTLWWKNSNGEYGVNLFGVVEVR